MVVQARWHDASTLTTLPHIDDDKVSTFQQAGIECIPELVETLLAGGQRPKDLARILLSTGFSANDFAQTCSTALSLPLVNVGWSMQSDVLDFREEAAIDIKIRLKRVNRSLKVYAPRFPKPKSEGHWLVLGCPAQGELLALKRVVVRNISETTLTFYADDIDQAGPIELALYLISDSYLGLDQQYSIPVVLVGEKQRANE